MRIRAEHDAALAKAWDEGCNAGLKAAGMHGTVLLPASCANPYRDHSTTDSKTVEEG